MKKRLTLVEKFSTFLKFINRNSSLVTNWEVNSKLESNMKHLVELDANGKEEFWTQYWLKEVLKQPTPELAKGHLSAYLEETCYWAAITTARKVSISDFTWMDCFQIARTVVAAEPVKLFAKYDSTRSRLDTYIQLKLKSAILEIIRVGREKEKYTDAALLRSLTKTCLKQALEKLGVLPAEIPRYLLAQSCFKEIYVPTKAAGSNQLQWADAKEVERICVFYNQSRLKLERSTAITGKELEALLLTCIKAVRDDIAPSIQSFDGSEMQIPAPEDDFWETESQTPERQQVNSILSNALNNLSANDLKMLEIEHGLGVKQADIGKAFNLKQYQVSRQLDRAKRVLVKALGEWSQKELGISLTLQQVETIANQIDDWLERYWKSQFFDILQKTLGQNFSFEVKFLKFYYSQDNEISAVTTPIDISESSVKERLLRVKQRLSQELRERVQTNLPIDINSLTSVEKSIATLVETWLKNAPYATFGTERR